MPLSNAVLDAPRHECLIRFEEARVMQAFCGALDRNLADMEKELGVGIIKQGQHIVLHGDSLKVERAEAALQPLILQAGSGRAVTRQDIEGLLALPDQTKGYKLLTRKKEIIARTDAQKLWLAKMFEHELSFGVGPAGTGKTYLAVATGVSMLLSGQVDKLIFSRPAVEAGERLGFLPGDMKEKVDPYMQPIYDALNDVLPGKMLEKMMTEKTVEIAPLAFMRGRTLANAFILLDEAQNATLMQMKMFLTRLGQNSRMAVTGDMSQVDLPRGTTSGLVEARRILANTEGIGMMEFTNRDVVRHPLVARILNAWEAAEQAPPDPV